MVFGVSFAFSLLLVRQQFEAACRTVEREAVAVQRIYRLAERFPEPGRSRVQDLAGAYTRAVVDQEWRAMDRGRASPKAGWLADGLGEAVRGLGPSGDAQN